MRRECSTSACHAANAEDLVDSLASYATWKSPSSDQTRGTSSRLTARRNQARSTSAM